MKTHPLAVLMLTLTVTPAMFACEKSANLGDPHKNDGGAASDGGGDAAAGRSGGSTANGGATASGGTVGLGGRGVGGSNGAPGGGGASGGSGGSAGGSGAAGSAGRAGTGGVTPGSGGRGGAAGASGGSGGAAGPGSGGAGAGGRGGSTPGSGGTGIGGRGGSTPGTGGAVGGATGSTICGLVAPQNGGGTSAVVRYEANGDLHVAYIDATIGWPRYAVRRSGVWQNELVERLAPTVGATEIRLAIDGAGAAHVVYRPSWLTNPTFPVGHKVMRYAMRSAGGVWTTPVEIVPEAENAAEFAITLDASGQPYVAYAQPMAKVPGNVVLLHRTAVGWSEELRKPVADAGGSVGAIDLATDESGRAFILAGPKLVIPGASGYTVVPLPSTLKLIAPPFAVNRAGTTIFLARQQGVIFGMDPFWTDETVPQLAYDRAPWLGLTSDERPLAAHTVYSNDALGGNAKYLTRVYRRDTSGWVMSGQYELVPPGGASSDVTRLREAQPVGLDPAGNPVILGGAGALRTLELRTQGAVTSEVDVRLEVAADRGAVADAAGRMVVVFNGGRLDEPAGTGVNGSYVARQGADGAMTVAKIAVPGTYAPATLVRDATARLYLVGYEGKTIRLATSPGDGTWTSEVLATFTGTFENLDTLAIALAADGAPHVYYGTLDAGVHGMWHVARGETPTRVGTDAVSRLHNTRAVIDSTGTPYVFYIGSGQTQAARWNGSLWQAASVAGYSFTAFLDSGGRPCLANISGALSTLSRVCLQGSGFVDEPLGTNVLALSIAPTFTDDKNAAHLLVGRSDGSVVVNPNTGAIESTFPLLESPSVIVTPAGTRLLYWNATERRIYVTGC